MAIIEVNVNRIHLRALFYKRLRAVSTVGLFGLKLLQFRVRTRLCKNGLDVVAGMDIAAGLSLAERLQGLSSGLGICSWVGNSDWCGFYITIRIY